MVSAKSAGSPGPGEITTACGSDASTSASVASYGTTATRAPSASSCSMIARFTPQSISAMRRRRCVPTRKRFTGGHARNERLRVRIAHVIAQPPFRVVQRGVADRKRSPKRPVLAQRNRDRARIGADQCRNALFVEPCGQIGLGQVMRRTISDLLDDRSGDAGSPVLRSASRDAVVTDHRIGERENLPRIRRVGERLFITGHAGVEDRFPKRDSLDTEPVTVEAASVSEKERRAGCIAPHAARSGAR